MWTEAEAKTKICPVGHMRTYSIGLCATTSCMAWRWKWDVNQTPPVQTNKGYCGMGGIAEPLETRDITPTVTP